MRAAGCPLARFASHARGAARSPRRRHRRNRELSVLQGPKRGVRACNRRASRQVGPVFQVIFNEISAAEISRLDTLLQLELLTEFRVTPEDLRQPDGERFGRMVRDGKTFYRYRAKGYRIYFEVVEGGVLVHRVLHKNTLKDFLYRSGTKKPGDEDEVLAESRSFWKLIEEGQRAKRA